MNPTLPLLLLLEAAHGSGAERALSSGERRALERFSARWSVELRPVHEATPEPASPAYPAAEPIALRVEELLEGARQASARLDEPGAEQALGEANRLLTLHPELPQAAWLRAEYFSLAAERAEASAGALAPEAAELRRQAQALEGSRAPAWVIARVPAPGRPSLGAQERHPEPRELEPAPPSSVSLSGLDGRDGVEWNGVHVAAPFHLNALPGEHALRVFRRGALIAAKWVEIGRSTASVRVEVPEIAPCSPEDLAGAALGRDAPEVPSGVLCPRWAVARRERGTLALALCHQSSCGRWQRFEPELTRVPAPPGAAAKSERFPRWATIALASASAALATSFVLWQGGVFDRRTTTHERWVYGGLSPDTP